MKKKLILILLIILALISPFIVLLYYKDTYTIEIEQIDNFSPDRKLIVYKNDKQINFKEIQYEDGTYLCSGTNPTISYSEVVGETKLIIKIDEKKQKVAKIVEK